MRSPALQLARARAPAATPNKAEAHRGASGPRVTTGTAPGPSLFSAAGMPECMPHRACAPRPRAWPRTALAARGTGPILIWLQPVRVCRVVVRTILVMASMHCPRVWYSLCDHRCGLSIELFSRLWALAQHCGSICYFHLFAGQMLGRPESYTQLRFL